MALTPASSCNQNTDPLYSQLKTKTKDYFKAGHLKRLFGNPIRKQTDYALNEFIPDMTRQNTQPSILQPIDTNEVNNENQPPSMSRRSTQRTSNSNDLTRKQSQVIEDVYHYVVEDTNVRKSLKDFHEEKVQRRSSVARQSLCKRKLDYELKQQTEEHELELELENKINTPPESLLQSNCTSYSTVATEQILFKDPMNQLSPQSLQHMSTSSNNRTDNMSVLNCKSSSSLSSSTSVLKGGFATSTANLAQITAHIQAVNVNQSKQQTHDVINEEPELLLLVPPPPVPVQQVTATVTHSEIHIRKMNKNEEFAQKAQKPHVLNTDVVTPPITVPVQQQQQQQKSSGHVSRIQTLKPKKTTNDDSRDETELMLSQSNRFLKKSRNGNGINGTTINTLSSTMSSNQQNDTQSQRISLLPSLSIEAVQEHRKQSKSIEARKSASRSGSGATDTAKAKNKADRSTNAQKAADVTKDKTQKASKNAWAISTDDDDEEFKRPVVNKLKVVDQKRAKSPQQKITSIFKKKAKKTFIESDDDENDHYTPQSPPPAAKDLLVPTQTSIRQPTQVDDIMASEDVDHIEVYHEEEHEQPELLFEASLSITQPSDESRQLMVASAQQSPVAKEANNKKVDEKAKPKKVAKKSTVEVVAKQNVVDDNDDDDEECTIIDVIEPTKKKTTTTTTTRAAKKPSTSNKSPKKQKQKRQVSPQASPQIVPLVEHHDDEEHPGLRRSQRNRATRRGLRPIYDVTYINDFMGKRVKVQTVTGYAKVTDFRDEYRLLAWGIVKPPSKKSQQQQAYVPERRRKRVQSVESEDDDEQQSCSTTSNDDSGNNGNSNDNNVEQNKKKSKKDVHSSQQQQQTGQQIKNTALNEMNTSRDNDFNDYDLPSMPDINNNSRDTNTSSLEQQQESHKNKKKQSQEQEQQHSHQILASQSYIQLCNDTEINHVNETIMVDDVDQQEIVPRSCIRFESELDKKNYVELTHGVSARVTSDCEGILRIDKKEKTILNEHQTDIKYFIKRGHSTLILNEDTKILLKIGDEITIPKYNRYQFLNQSESNEVYLSFTFNKNQV